MANPPPGPGLPVPRVINPSDVKPVSVPAVPGATSWIVLPLAPTNPQFPPVPHSVFESSDGTHIRVDAGSIDTTVQIVYEPIPLEKAPAGSSRQELIRVFRLSAANHNGDSIHLQILRPLVLEVPAIGRDPSRVMLAVYDKDSGWTPLVTAYHKARGVLQTRLLELGQFAVLGEPTIITGVVSTGVESRLG